MSTPIESDASRHWFWWLQSGGWLGYASLSYLQALAHGKSPDYWRLSFGVALAGFVVTLGVRQVLKRAWGWPPRRFVPLAGGCVLLATALVGLASITLVLDWCGASCRPASPLGYFASGTGQFYVVLSWVAFYVGIKYYRQLQQQTRQALAANAMAHQAQLKMLRYQLNPHFLFNTLNAISTLVLDRQNELANRMVQGLGSFLRHSLDSDPMQRVTLKQELDALNLYLGIEKVRFDERLAVETRIESGCYSALLPGMLLQPLVENAIKHAISHRVSGGRLVIGASRQGDRLCLTVSDNGPGEQAGPPAPRHGNGQGTGTGLSNTRERLRVLYGEAQSVQVVQQDSGGVEVRLSLPFESGGAPRP